MNEDKILYCCYQSRLQSCKLLSKLLDLHKEECNILHKLCTDHPELKLSSLSDKSLTEIQKDQLIMLSRLETEAFMHTTQIKKIDRILKYRKKPIIKD